MNKGILDVTGIGPAAAKLLAEHNINTAADLATASAEQIVAVPGFSKIRASRVIAAAAELLDAASKSPTVNDSQGDSEVKDAPVGKGKKPKKAKGKKKDQKKKKDKSKGKKKDKKKKKKKNKKK